MSDRQVLIGEFGSDRLSGSTAAQRAAYYENIRQICLTTPNVVGAIQWAIMNSSYGIYDASGVLQTDIADTWAAFDSTPLVNG